MFTLRIETPFNVIKLYSRQFKGVQGDLKKSIFVVNKTCEV